MASREETPGAARLVSRLNPLLLWSAATLAGLSAALILWLWVPPADPEFSICLFRRLGGSCPTCGMTRALAALVKGDWRASFVLHPLALLLAIEAAVIWLASGTLIVAGRFRAPGWRRANAAILAHGLLFLVLWVVRGVF